MKADPAEQLRLLELQGIDTALDQLAHRREHLPEIAQIRLLEDRLQQAADEVVLAETEVSDLAREQRRLESDVDQVRARAARDQQRMQAGTSAKEAGSLQHEVESLARRQSELEDQVLELMERREEADTRLGAAKSQMAALQDELAGAAARRDEALADMDRAVATHREQRAQAAEGVGAELLGLYEKIRASSGGTGAARLFRRRCEGCHLELSGGDLSAVRSAPADEVVRCEECRRILVRTAESGL